MRTNQDWKSLHRLLGGTDEGRGVFLQDGEGTIDLGDAATVFIAVVYDVQGYGPHSGAIYADQNHYHASPDTALQAAYEILEQHVLDNTDAEYIAELEDEWGDDWHDILMETIDGQTWVLTPTAAARAITGTDAEQYIEVYEDEG